MQQVNLQAIYQLACSVHRLGELEADIPLIDVAGRFTATHWLLEHLLEGRPVPLPRTIPFAQVLDDLLKELVKKLGAGPYDVKLSMDAAFQIRGL